MTEKDDTSEGSKYWFLERSILNQKLVNRIHYDPNPENLLRAQIIPLSTDEGNRESTSNIFMVTKGRSNEHVGMGQLLTNKDNEESNVIEFLGEIAANYIIMELTIHNGMTKHHLKVALLAHEITKEADFTRALMTITEGTGLFQDTKAIVWGVDNQANKTNDRGETFTGYFLTTAMDKQRDAVRMRRMTWTAIKSIASVSRKFKGGFNP